MLRYAAAALLVLAAQGCASPDAEPDTAYDSVTPGPVEPPATDTVDPLAEAGGEVSATELPPAEGAELGAPRRAGDNTTRDDDRYAPRAVGRDLVGGTEGVVQPGSRPLFRF